MKRKYIIATCILLFGIVAGKYITYRYFGSLPYGTKIDKLVVDKSDKKMMAYSRGRLIKVYNVALGKGPSGPKRFKGDRKTPEGTYKIFNKNPNSSCHKNLGVSYPNLFDRAYAAANGKSAGGSIKIHGLSKRRSGIFHYKKNWTLGCIAVTNREIDELYRYVKVGASITINP